MVGYSNPELVAAVTNTGALGYLVAGNLSVDNLNQQCQKIMALTERVYAVNFFVSSDSAKQTQEPLASVYEALLPYYRELGLDEDALYQCQSPSPPDLVEQLDAVIAMGVPVVSFTFGLPAKHLIDNLKRHDIKVIGNATTINEAKMVQAAGCDAVVLQGIEAGGHRASFPDAEEDSGQELLSLLAQANDHLSIPVIAAGGIMNGGMIATCLKGGAQAAQLGTAFLFTQEAGVDDTYLQALSADQIETTLSRSFTGKYARVINDQFTYEMLGQPTSGFPQQGILTTALRDKADELGRSEFLPYWAGQSALLDRKGTATWLMETLITELESEVKG